MDTPPAIITNMAADTLCEGGLHTGNSYVSLRIVGIFAILIASCLGVFLPMAAASHKNVTFFVKTFSGGVIIGTAFIHVLTDSNEALTQPCIGCGEYPWTFLITSLSLLLMFTAEFYMDKALECLEPPQVEAAMPSSSDRDAVALTVASKELHTSTDDEQDQRTQWQLTLRSYSLEMGIIFHSIFIGIALGVNQQKDTITSLMVALAFHQLNEGLALGMTFVAARFGAAKYVLFATLFSVVTPMGVVIGMLVGNHRYGSSKGALITEGVVNAASAGVLLHNGLVDVILPTFTADAPTTEPLRFCGFVSLFLGCISMAVIGKWA